VVSHSARQETALEDIVDPLLNPYYFSSEVGDTALGPQEIQSLKKIKTRRKYDAPVAKNIL
jgi:hypothetical protein